MMFVTQLAAALFLQSRQVVPAGPPPSMSTMPTNPVSKVVKLLQDMSVELQEQEKGDEEVYEKYSCWCETTIKEKTDALAAAATRRDELQGSIEDGTATIAKLKTELKLLKEERAANEEAVKTATELRAKEKEEFEAATAEQRATIAAISKALEALEKGTGLTALLQVKTHLARQQKPFPAAFQSWLETAQQQPANFKSYNARSGQIVGILAQMKDDFTNDIKEATEEEAAAQAAYEKLVAAKKAEIKAQTESILEKTKLKTEAEVALVQAKHDLKDLEQQVAEDEKVLADANERCPKMDEEFAARKEKRQEEIDAIAEALKILTEDEARDLFSATFAFVQVKAEQKLHAKMQLQARQRASQLIQRAALKAGQSLKSASLMQLATTVKLDAFTKVLAYVEDMIAQLTKEQAAEVEHQRWCNDELRKNAQETQAKTWKQEDLTKEVNDLASTLEALDDDLKTLEEAIAENLRVIKRAGEDREAANAEFKMTVEQQRGAVAILTKVLERLQKVYAPDVLKQKQENARIAAQNAENARRQEMTPGAAAAGIKVADDQQAIQPISQLQQPAGFDQPYERQSSGGVLGLIEQCISDAKRLSDEATKEEQEQQTAYEKLVTDTGAAVAADRQSVSDKKGERSEAALAKDEAEKDLQATGKVLTDLAAYATSVHSACDFVLQNFDLRQEARASEIDALKQAHAILSGADFS